MSNEGLPRGVATGIGSLPGTDPVEALRMVLDELPDFPHLPELPGRGPGADMLGRTAALLVDLCVDLQPSGWRFVARPGRDLHRAADYLAHDLDTLEELAGDYTGAIKVQLAGPWTLAAGIELGRGDKAISDPGAVHDLTESLAEGLRLHLADLRGRLPRGTVVVQVDEPALPMVLAGRVPTASGFGTLRAVDEQTVEGGLRDVLGAAGCPTIVHCCAADPPIELLVRLGIAGVSLDAELLRQEQDDQLGEAVEAGVALLLGVVPASDGDLPTGQAHARTIRTIWERLGFGLDRLGEVVLVTPRCGLVGISPAGARAAMVRSRETAANLLDRD